MKYSRVVIFAMLLVLVGTIAYLAFFTPMGRDLVHHPHTFRPKAQELAHAHYLLAPLAVIVLFTLFTLAAMPVWWILVLAGAAFGFYMGVFWSVLAAAVAATCTVCISRYLAADLFHGKIEAKMAKLKAIDEKLSHNGFLVVMVARLVHVLPFSLSYYMFGLTTMTATDAFLGTFLGYIPFSMLMCRTGAGWKSNHPSRFIATLILVQGLLLLPVLLRYLFPAQFKKAHLE